MDGAPEEGGGVGEGSQEPAGECQHGEDGEELADFIEKRAISGYRVSQIASEARVSQRLVRDHLDDPPVATKVQKSREALVCTLQDQLKSVLNCACEELADIMRNADPCERIRACELALQISKELAQDPTGAVQMTMKFSKKMKSRLPPPETLSNEQRADVIRRTAFVEDST